MRQKKIGQQLGTVLMTGMLLLAVIPLAAIADEQAGGNDVSFHQRGPGQAARQAFLTDTAGLRRQMAVKRATMRALMQQDNPDIDAVAQLAGEIFDLREQLRAKAQEAGLPHRTMMPGMGMGQHPCNGGPQGPMPGGFHHMGAPW